MGLDVMHADWNQASWQVCSSSAAAVMAMWRQSAKPQPHTGTPTAADPRRPAHLTEREAESG
jgi:hypothetical protein